MLIDSYKSIQDDIKCAEIVEFFKTFEIKNKEEYNKFVKEKNDI